MQQSEFLVSGNLYRRGNDNSSWANRLVTLSTDTGAMKLYIEKSGKKTIKGQLNIRKSKLSELPADQTGRAFCFEIVTEELIGRSDESVLVFAAGDQDQLSTWLTAIKSCFTIGEVGRRRQSVMSESTRSLSGIFRSVSPVPESAPASEEITQPTLKPVPVTPGAAKNFPPPVSAPAPISVLPNTVKAAEPAVEEVPVALSTAALSNPLFAEIEKKKALKKSSETSPEKSSGMRRSVSFREPAAEAATEKEEEPPQLSAAALANPMLAEIERKKALRKSAGSTPAAAIVPAAVDAPGEEKASAVKLPRRQSSEAVADLERKMGRTSYKKPQFKGLLGDMIEQAHTEADAKEAVKVAAAAAESASTTAVTAVAFESVKDTTADTTESTTGAVDIEAKKLPIPVVLRKLEIINRPTEPTRMGYLHKLDGHIQELGEDSWISQFVTLEIATGELKYFAEIGGRRILRGTIYVNDHVIHAVDYVYFGRLFSFEILTRAEDGEDGSTGDSAVAVFAAEDSESFSYWLISVEDCKLHQEKLRQEEEEKKRQAEVDATMINRQASNRASFTPFFGSQEADLLILRASLTGSGGSSPEQEDVKLVSKSEDLFEKEPAGKTNQRSLSVPGRTPSFSMNNNKSMELLPSSRDMHSLLQLQRQPSARDMSMRPTGTSREFEHAKPSRPPSSALFGTGSSSGASAAGDLIQRMDSYRNLPSTASAPNHSAKESRNNDSHILDPLIEVNNANLDDILKSPDVTQRKGIISSGLLSSAQNLRLPATDPATTLPDVKEVDALQIEFVKIIYPTERLSRRIKLWYCSSGFSISSEDEVLHFVRELRNTDDVTLQAFSHEKFSFLNDWAKLLELLRKYEAHSVHDRRGNSTHTPRKVDEKNMTIQIKVRNPQTGTVIPVHVDEQMDILALSKEIAKEFHLSESTLMKRLPALLSSKDAALAKGLQTMREDMTFAEDLVLYQEEVIEQMWNSYSALKSLVEQKDGVINQLYTQLSDLQDKHKLLQLGAIHDLPSTVFATLHGSYRGQKAIPTRDVNLIADREFNLADLDGDGRISREEWRKWIQDKHNLIAEHNAVKHVLMDEIKMLRKALTPLSEEAFDDLKKSEDIRRQQEEELICIHIENDNLKAEVFELHNRVKEAEHERAMVDTDWREKFTTQQKEVDTTKVQLQQLQAQFDELLKQQAQAVVEKEELLQQQQKLQQQRGRYPAQPQAQPFTPIQQVLQNPGSNSIANPYTYNMPEDRPTGLVTQQHYATNALLGREISDDNYNYDSGFDLNSLAQGQLDISPQQQQQQQAKGQVEATRWLQQISGNGNAITLGANNVSNHSLGTLTPNSYSTVGNNNRAGSASRFEFRSPDDDDNDYYAYQQPRHQQQQQLQLQQPLNDMMLPPRSRQYPSSSTLIDHQHQHRLRQSTPTDDLFESKADYSSSYASLSRLSPQQPPPPQLVGNADHPLRNALRMEVKMKNHPPTMLAAQQVLPQLTRGDSVRRSRRSDTSTSPFLVDRSESPPVSYRSVGNTRDPSPFTSAAQSIQSGGVIPGPVSQLKKQLMQQQQQKSTPQSSTTPRGLYEQDGKMNRAGSPFRFMQQTSSWKSKATSERGLQVQDKQPGEIVIRAANWR